MPQPILYIISGANGSGKTTFALQFIEIHNLPFVNADELAKSINPNDFESAKIEAGRHFFKAIDYHFCQKTSFVIESTLSGQYLKKIIGKAKSIGYQIEITYVYVSDTSPETNIDRVLSRTLLGGHNIPIPDIIRRFYRSRFLFWNTYLNLCDHWTLVNNLGKDFKEIVYGDHLTLTVLHDSFYDRFKEGIENDI